MSMTCRRCDGKIEADEIANIIRNVVVGECCRRVDEQGFTEQEPILGRPVSQPVPGDEAGLGVTRRRVEILQLAEDGLVTRQGNCVNAFDRHAGVMRDSKSVVKALKAHEFVWWERQPMQGFLREAPKWKLKLTPEGRDWLKKAEKELLGAVAG